MCARAVAVIDGVRVHRRRAVRRRACALAGGDGVRRGPLVQCGGVRCDGACARARSGGGAHLRLRALRLPRAVRPPLDHWSNHWTTGQTIGPLVKPLDHRSGHSFYHVRRCALRLLRPARRVTRTRTDAATPRAHRQATGRVEPPRTPPPHAARRGRTTTDPFARFDHCPAGFATAQIVRPRRNVFDHGSVTLAPAQVFWPLLNSFRPPLIL